jgi:hypothetical protein
MRLFTIAIIFLIFDIMCGCGRTSTTITKKSTDVINYGQSPSQEAIPSQATEVISDEASGKIVDDKYYSLNINGNLLTVRSDEETVLKLLGEPIKTTKVKQLGEGADTFSNMFKKTFTYEGLEINFLGMATNTLWVSDFILTKPTFETSEGITVGDSLRKLTTVYPNIVYLDKTVRDEWPNTKVYEFYQDEYGYYADFIINEELKIVAIEMYFVFD